jgi:hypothetical protein
LIRIGLTPGAIKHLVEIGFLYRVHRGVYAVGRPPTTPEDRAAADVLACGERAALAHFGAAALWTAWGHWPTSFDVIAPTRRRHPGIRTHQLVLPPCDIRARLGIRVTSPARTALDCAPTLDRVDLRRLVNNLRVREPSRLSDTEIADIVERNPRHPGAKRLAWFIGEGISESQLEDVLFPWCDEHGVPRPETQVWLHGFRVDALYTREKVILELDGWESHQGRESFESDRDRDATLAEFGFIVIRVTWWRFKQDPAREAARLLRILDQRRRLLAA